MDILREELLPGVSLSCLQTDKFKSDCLSVSLLTALDRETVSKNALLPRVLARGTVMHPDMDAIAAACDELAADRADTIDDPVDTKKRIINHNKRNRV